YVTILDLRNWKSLICFVCYRVQGFHISTFLIFFLLFDCLGDYFLLLQSGFEEFVRDKYTLLPETRERMMATEVTTSWRYTYDHVSQIPPDPFCFTERYKDVKKVLEETFFGPPDTGVYSPSVQNTLYLMAKAVLNRFQDIASIHLRMPNLHFLPVNLSSKENPTMVKFDNDVYVPTDEPHGTIEATLSRTMSKM
ncbi:uricase-like, partial [Ananas comosus]|uniref:Uricase n=1 Tax=Ananas comosus TaxID=4615 RepID=A0A6P5EDM4_ANACO